MIEVSSLTKNYGSVEAVKNVSFTVAPDQVLGFLGPNGAGKTTIMKILTGFHFPSSGKALIDGLNVTEEPVEVKRRIGYLPESAPLYGEFTVDEYLSFIACARQIPKGLRKRAVDKAMEACGLGAMRGRRIETLSKGYRQRTGLAQAILHDPPILVLDEPTTGLDPNQIIEIRSLIKELGRSKTVILSTHILQEVDAVCNRVLILNGGRIAAQGTPAEIAGAMRGGETWTLRLKAGVGASTGVLQSALEGLSRRLGQFEKTGVEEDSGSFNLSFFLPDAALAADAATAGAVSDTAGNESAEVIFDWALESGFKILLMNREKMSLEDIFVSLTQEARPGSDAPSSSSTFNTGITRGGRNESGI
jgi:ABC-2 type transport system ATP-binding protein